MSTNEPRLKEILDRNCTEATLIENVQKLDLVSEDPDFWLNIVRDKTYSATHRRVAIVQYFVRHSYYRKASELRLHSLNLLTSEWEVQVMRMVAGVLPFRRDIGDICVRIFFTFDKQSGACVYLAIFPNAEDSELIDALNGRRPESAQIITDVAAGEQLLSGADITWNRWQRGQVYKWRP